VYIQPGLLPDYGSKHKGDRGDGLRPSLFEPWALNNKQQSGQTQGGFLVYEDGK
jgi:hypothetical protein